MSRFLVAEQGKLLGRDREETQKGLWLVGKPTAKQAGGKWEAGVAAKIPVHTDLHVPLPSLKWTCLAVQWWEQCAHHVQRSAIRNGLTGELEGPQSTPQGGKAVGQRQDGFCFKPWGLDPRSLWDPKEAAEGLCWVWNPRLGWAPAAQPQGSPRTAPEGPRHLIRGHGTSERESFGTPTAAVSRLWLSNRGVTKQYLAVCFAGQGWSLFWA